MMKKKIYISPQITLDDIEEQTGILDTASVGGSHQPADGEWDVNAKSAKYFSIDDAFDDPFASAEEVKSNEFQYTLDF